MTTEIRPIAAESLRAWSELPGDPLCLIGRRLIKLNDFIRFRAVCKPWRQTLMADGARKFKSSVPWLMLPYCSDSAMVVATAAAGSSSSSSCTDDRCRLFYDVAEQKFHHVELPAEGGLGRMVNCRGSVSGWVFTFRGGSLFLTNPFTGDRISLPGITAFPDVLGYRPEKRGHEILFDAFWGRRISESNKFMEKYYIRKIALSCPPQEEEKECIAMVIRTPSCFEHQLGFCKLPSRRRRAGVDDEAEEEEEEEEVERGWTLIPHLEGYCLMDVVFWRGQFYVVEQQGRVSVCDISEPDRPELRLFTTMDEITRAADIVYLVICPKTDHLMFVARWSTYVNEKLVVEEEEEEAAAATATEEELEEEEEEEGDGGPVDQYNHNDDGDAATGDDETDAIASDLGSDDEIQDPPGVNLNDKLRYTTKFAVFKLNEDTKGWDEAESIGEFAFFLGFNTAACVSTEDHPELAPNSIYFTDDLVEGHYKKLLGGYDMGIYSLDTHTVRPLYDVSSVHKNPLFIHPSPIWVLPFIS